MSRRYRAAHPLGSRASPRSASRDTAAIVRAAAAAVRAYQHPCRIQRAGSEDLNTGCARADTPSDFMARDQGLEPTFARLGVVIQRRYHGRRGLPDRKVHCRSEADVGAGRKDPEWEIEWLGFRDGRRGAVVHNDYFEVPKNTVWTARRGTIRESGHRAAWNCDHYRAIL